VGGVGFSVAFKAESGTDESDAVGKAAYRRIAAGDHAEAILMKEASV
jgi:hypothetical protein